MKSCVRNINSILRHRSVFREANVLRTFSKITSPASRKSKKSAIHEIEEPDEYEIEYNFDVEVRKTIQKVHDAVLPMKKTNVGFDVALVMGESEPSLTIITARGKIDFTVDYPRRILNLKSFMSGIHFYAFQPEEAVWLSTKDNHDMRGLVTRDLIKHCTGCPNLDMDLPPQAQDATSPVHFTENSGAEQGREAEGNKHEHTCDNTGNHKE